jgi:nicotinate-nucleotide adenylyltransferase
MRQNILVFGGSFDPPHLYHIRLLHCAIKKINPEKVIIFPTYLSPFKSAHAADYVHRRNMISILMLKHHIKFDIVDFELRKKRKVYTFEIASYMHNKYPDSNLYFLMGSDSFKDFRKWKRYRDVIKYFHIVVGIRKGYSVRKKYGAIILGQKFDNISSTSLRKRMLLMKYSDLDTDIKKYIIRNGLYFSNFILKVKSLVKRRRFRHIISTVKLAVELAEKNNYDITKAFLAALLHDSAKDMSISEQLSLIKRAGIRIKDIEKIKTMAPDIIHQWAGMALSMKLFKIKDRDVLEAISKHTTGDKTMSLLDKIIYVSDFACEERDFKEAEEIREIAYRDIEKAFFKTRQYKEEFIKKCGGFLYE